MSNTRFFFMFMVTCPLLRLASFRADHKVLPTGQETLADVPTYLIKTEND